MNDKIAYKSYAGYLKDRYGARVFRVAVDPGFSCPNRISRDAGGCVYCDSRGSRAVYLDEAEAVREQVENGIAFLKKRYRAEVFLLYFQAFSGTFSSTDRLRQIYDYSLSLGDFRELIVSTRPDCIDREKADLLASYRDRGYDVWVELGLQSCHDRTLRRINRGHTVEDFENACSILRENGIKTAVHLIFGLPGESFEDMMQSVNYTASLKPAGVKFHNLHVPKDTALHRQYLTGSLSVPCLIRHVVYLSEAIERLGPETVVMRLTCDTPAERRIAPVRDLKKTEVYSVLNKYMVKNGKYQGRLYRG